MSPRSCRQHNSSHLGVNHTASAESGMRVNLEFDLLAKYIAKMTGLQKTDTITLDKLREYGY
jgi:riboflavin synthase alpha subunit